MLLRGIALVCVISSIAACSKDKADFIYDASYPSFERSKSRIVNVHTRSGMYTQMTGNGVVLTNVIDPYSGSDYFPSRGQYGGIWQAPVWEVPSQLFDKNGEVNFFLFGNSSSLIFDVTGGKDKPQDYYIIRPLMDRPAHVIPIERDLTAPSKADHFKIRVVNLAHQVSDVAFIADYVKPLTLTYADGSAVSPKTSNITPTNSSEYIELPYGTYQFRVRTDDGRLVSGNNIENDNGDFSTINMSMDNSTLITTLGDSKLVFAPIETYQPGGIYTIVICPQSFSGTGVQNGFIRVVDNELPVNTRFGRVQGVNAYVDQTVSFKVNGHSLANNLAYPAHSDYSILAVGKFDVQAIGANGQVLATAQGNIKAGDNYSFWLYGDKDGKPAISIVANDLSGIAYKQSFSDDGRDNYMLFDMPLGVRFLNMSADVPYLTFRLGDGTKITAKFNDPQYGNASLPQYENDNSFVNLELGKPATQFPYIWVSYKYAKSFEFVAYKSSPSLIPGAWLDQVDALKSENFVVAPNLYPQQPTYDSGIFSVALIGKIGATEAHQKAKLWFVKHTK